MSRANIFVNTPTETSYFYQDLAEHGDRLDGTRAYSVTFLADGLPPVRGFWSITLYNQHHFFHPNDLDRYSLGAKDKALPYNTAGSLTLAASHQRPDDDAAVPNWLPAPDGPFSLYLLAYWPTDNITSAAPGPRRQSNGPDSTENCLHSQARSSR